MPGEGWNPCPVSTERTLKSWSRMTSTWLPSAFVTCTSYFAAALLLSFSVDARSAVPPTLATAAALALAATSPVSSVSPFPPGPWPRCPWGP